jgi:hypothetical protein
MPDLFAGWSPIAWAAWTAGAYLAGSLPWTRLLLLTLHPQPILANFPAHTHPPPSPVPLWVRASTLLLEILIACAAVLAPAQAQVHPAIPCLAGLALAAGARWPVWSSFKGGCPSAGAAAALLLAAYPALLGFLAVWILVRLLTNDTTRALRWAVVLLPLLLALITHSAWYTTAGAGVTLLALGPGNLPHK